MACVGKYLAQLVRFPRHSAVVPWSLTMAWAVRSMPSLLLAVWSTIFTRSKGAQIVLARQLLLPPRIEVLRELGGADAGLGDGHFRYFRARRWRAASAAAACCRARRRRAGLLPVFGLLAILSGVSCRSSTAAIRTCENGFVQLPGAHSCLAIARGRNDKIGQKPVLIPE